MTQQLPGDFPIDPTTTSGTALADILNRQNGAMNSTNAGPVAPTTNFPGQQWLDTSVAPAVLRIRNAGNTGWDVVPTSASSALLPNGSVTVPALAFASEPGTGWYRRSGGIIGMSFAGRSPFGFDLNANNFAITAGANGNASVSLDRVTAAGYTNSITGRVGGLARWDVQLGGGGAVADFNIVRFNDAGAGVDTALTIARATGTVGFSSGIYLGANPQFAMYQSGNIRILQFQNSWGFQWDAATGNLAWARNGVASTTFVASGDLYAGGNVYCGVSGGLGMVQNGNNPHIRFTADQWKLEWGAGNLIYYHPNGTSLFNLRADGVIIAAGGGFKPGGGPWSDSSDVRIKEDVQDYGQGLAAVLQLRPVTYRFKAETGRDSKVLYHGLIAQEAELPMPEMVTSKATKVGSIELPDMRFLDTSPLVFALVNAVKELTRRLEKIEVAPPGTR